MSEPRFIALATHGHPEEGYLHVMECAALPFIVRRIFYAVDTPAHVTRGKHAHFTTEMLLIAARGEIRVKTIMIGGAERMFILNRPDQGLYLPKLCWHEMTYSPEAVQLVLCSTPYQEEDYIRDWSVFQSLSPQHGNA